LAGWMVLALAGAALLGACGRSTPVRQSIAPRAAASPARPAKPAPATPAAASLAPTLEAPFAAAYPKPHITMTAGHPTTSYALKPVALVPVADGVYALVSAGRYAGNPSHMDGGFASVAYLTTRPVLAVEGRPFPLGGTMGGFGEPAHVKVLTGIAKGPMLQ